MVFCYSSQNGHYLRHYLSSSFTDGEVEGQLGVAEHHLRPLLLISEPDWLLLWTSTKFLCLEPIAHAWYPKTKLCPHKLSPSFYQEGVGIGAGRDKSNKNLLAATRFRELRPWKMHCISSIWCSLSLPLCGILLPIETQSHRISQQSTSEEYTLASQTLRPQVQHLAASFLPWWAMVVSSQSKGWGNTPGGLWCMNSLHLKAALHLEMKGRCVDQLWACEFPAGTLGCTGIAGQQLGRSPCYIWQSRGSLKIRLHTGTWGKVLVSPFLFSLCLPLPIWCSHALSAWLPDEVDSLASQQDERTPKGRL